MSVDDLGDRMKVYEGIECDRTLIPRLPIYARLDGRSFSRFTKSFERPFDTRMVTMMVETTKYLVDQTHALIGYTQSDEISLAWYVPDPKSQMLFGGKFHKLHSVLAGLATAKFNHLSINMGMVDKYPTFDCRVFNLPDLTELANAFLWRELDATKNAISMAAQHYFSHSQLQNKNGKEMQEMLFQEHSINFNDYPDFFKRGTFVKRIVENRVLSEKELEAIPEKHRPKGPVARSRIIELPMPRLLSIKNREGVLFAGEQPKLHGDIT